MDEITPAYAGEAMLLGWGETATRGRTITLQLDEEATTHPFKGFKAGMNGQRMKICAVLIDDHEQPQEPDRARRSGPTKVAEKKADGDEVHKERTPFDKLPKSQQAGIKCGDDDFDAWLRRLDGDVASEDTTTLLYYHLGITSRKDLDNDAAAAERWDRMLTSFEMRSHAR
jgi:hypothetical protein